MPKHTKICSNRRRVNGLYWGNSMKYHRAILLSPPPAVFLIYERGGGRERERAIVTFNSAKRFRTNSYKGFRFLSPNDHSNVCDVFYSVKYIWYWSKNKIYCTEERTQLLPGRREKKIKNRCPHSYIIKRGREKTPFLIISARRK